jgi:hypothetical protein
VVPRESVARADDIASSAILNANTPQGSRPRPLALDTDRPEDFISLGSFSLTDAAKLPTPIPNAAEANLATPSALSQNKNLPIIMARAPAPEPAATDRLEDSISVGSFSLTDVAKLPTPIPNAAEALAAATFALSQKTKLLVGEGAHVLVDLLQRTSG